MTVALWCILIAALLHLPFTLAAKWSRRFDNARPRDYMDQLDGWRKRAHWSQLNMIEAFPVFAAAVLTAHIVAGPQRSADSLAIAFVLLRLAYGVCYIVDQATLRSLMWMGALGCSVGLFIVAAIA